jgi:sugar lactone lactonase YvrE
MSRTLASAGVLAAAAGAVAFTSTSAQAAPRFTNGHIAWVGNTGGWSESAPDGSGVHTVTPSGGGYDGTGKVTGVSYSPDGTKVAFTVTLPGDLAKAGELWVADASGANAHRLVSGVGGVSQVAWAPDGSKLYFALQVYQVSNRINVVNIDGSGLAELPGQANCDSFTPTVAPSGRVAFEESCANTNSGMPSAVAYDPGATTLRKLTNVRASYAIAYSPDGEWIAYIDSYGGLHGGLYLVPANGGSARIQVTGANVGGSVTWSPDGASLLTWTTSATGGVLNKVATKPNAPLVPIASQTDVHAPSQASWQTGASTAPARPTADRIGGADRIETAVLASQWSFDDTGTGGRQAATAVITRSDTFADALAGNALAAEKDGPLFMTGTTALDQRVKDELVRILPHGATVYVLGGTRALSTDIDTEVAALGFRVARVAGDGQAYADDRYGTAQAIADQITGYSMVGGGPVPTTAPNSVFVATGADYPDALAAGAAAAQDPTGTGVVMLSAGTSLLPWTQDYLARLDPKKTHVYTVGGQATAAVAKAFPSWKGLTTPLAGGDRFETAYKVATSGVFGSKLAEVGIATSANWPDALSGGALIGLRHGPLLLSDKNGLTPQELSVLRQPGIGGLAVFGGPAVVSDQALSGAADTAFGVGGWDKGLNRKAPALK